MSVYRNHEEIRLFLKKVCSEIRAREVHQGVCRELETHLEELIEDRLAQGDDRDTAVREAIRRMGSPEIIGEQLNRAHRPRVDWGMLGLIALLMLVGLVAVFSAYQAMDGRARLGAFHLKQIFYFTVGGCLMLGIGFSNYSKWAKYAWGMYVGMLALLVYGLVTSTTMNGLRGIINIPPFHLNPVFLSPYVFLIALAGIWSKPIPSGTGEPFRNRAIRHVWLTAGVLWVPAILLLYAHSIMNFVLLLIGGMTLVVILKKSAAVLLAHLSLVVVAVGIFLLKLSTHANARQNFLAWIRPSTAPDGENYMIAHSKLAIQSAGWQGHGFGAQLSTLPNLQESMMFPFLIYCFGWLAGICLVLMILMLIQRSIQVARTVQDDYGKAMVSALLTIIAVQYLWNMLMSVGLAPLSSFSLPFVSFNGSLVVMQFIAIGLALSVYRRKDIARWSRRPEMD
ncbi:FtsW/RodA/SpoVE family cell cycle protein [Paenibacillus whitsoniae]|uniref:FtsW/RodA/SpoVE family cell cycle protein n=1 Tax=Paenibacillus whitsoniae TaxID=2496558 RepID=A0A430JC37_9BACL|nr:FtsW/RodA/SpoVE family cell cycle protein [Paenibacillus whitsoniae]RTE08567.1 FtsW/RodA/SpoVE family cell cycle protein [Paenibacillus whitsoniae]